jgi:hypothetical protein
VGYKLRHYYSSVIGIPSLEAACKVVHRNCKIPPERKAGFLSLAQRMLPLCDIHRRYLSTQSGIQRRRVPASRLILYILSPMNDLWQLSGMSRSCVVFVLLAPRDLSNDASDSTAVELVTVARHLFPSSLHYAAERNKKGKLNCIWSTKFMGLAKPFMSHYLNAGLPI